MLSAVNDALLLRVDRMYNGTVAVQIGSGANASAEVVLEGTLNGDDWFGVQLLSYDDQSGAASELVGPGAVGFAPMPGIAWARVRCTVLPAGDCPVWVSHRQP